MRKGKQAIVVVAIAAAFIATGLFLPGLIGAGELEPPAGAVDEFGKPVSTMHTLDEIYNKLQAIEVKMYAVNSGCNLNYRFCDMGDGTILDLHTGLFWLKDASCFGMKNWNDAMAAAAGLAHGSCGLTDGSVAGDWRLPTKAEWEHFVDKNYNNPALCNAAGTGKWSEGDAFTGVWPDRYYWSSTECGSDAAWDVDTGDGYMSCWTKYDDDYVWPVRSGN